jgi:hypothetical protein
MSASLAADPRYAVRFANVGVWDATTGMNRLNASVTVTGGSAMGVEQRGIERPCRKWMQDGRLIIERNGVRYSAQGTRL